MSTANMKLLLTAIVFAAATLANSASISNSTVADECGALGAMEVSSTLPDGILSSDVRKCARHPLGELKRPGVSLSSRDEEACVTSAAFGCDKGFCWKVCGAGGQW